MASSLGQGLVLLGLLACALGVPVGYYSGAARSAPALAWTRRLTLVFAAAMAAATAVMVVALLRHDFSVSYVAQVGSLATPTHITIVSLWSSLEGSILFWGFVLGAFAAGVALLQRTGHADYLGYTLATVLVVGTFFCFLIAGPANPFRPTPLPIPTDGPGPNPLLQNHILMIVHPPMLYVGYVGMTVPFAMAVAALLRGQLGVTWLRPLRAWLLVPTGFLTVGIMLGGWWSYEVLGWGGYWAWDPVENASFLPWLTAIAAVHSALVLERRGSLKAWTVILVLVTFLLTILGTFLTRSGVVNSVHSFTQSPIGPLFLGFLGFCIVGVVVLLSWRVDRLTSEPSTSPLVSRETGFMLNNLLLVAFTFTVLVGTLFPIVAEAVKGVKVSVGEPYFNRMSVPICFALLALMGIGPALPWGRADGRKLRRALLWPLPAAVVAGIAAWALGGRNGWVVWAAALGGYALWVAADQGLRPARARRRGGASLAAGIRGSLRQIGGYVVHGGVIVTFVAIAISANYKESVEGTLRPGGQLELADYQLTFDSVALDQEPHLTAQRATISVTENGKSRGVLVPALNFYPTMREPLGTPAVRTSLVRDLYLTVMNVSNDGSIGLRAIVTPAVAWIWIGVLVMGLGTVLCLAGAAKPRGSAA
ncbi:MAG: heme lyase CcmF/NrfE family subunit [Acidobacteriota bacterium]|nr:heme lyase CcmF/NrfE family subunit [Acidobacteriota bacterium]MDH3522963.1 heme lyase CcmF/NrfE family subunit [Acidobacteriota bacterium]